MKYIIEIHFCKNSFSACTFSKWLSKIVSDSLFSFSPSLSIEHLLMNMLITAPFSLKTETPQ